MMRRVLTALVLMCACGGATFAQTATATPAQKSPKPAPVAKNDYSNGDDWLCRPGRQDSCATDLSTTVISADGKLTHEDWAANPDAEIDCFYVYPTVSTDPAGNSTMTLGPEEKAVARVQFARFASKCRVYAPLYRQVTLTALRAALTGSPIPVDRALAYNHVL